MSKTVFSSSEVEKVVLRRAKLSVHEAVSMRTRKRSSSMGALKRCGTTSLLFFLFFFILCQLFLAFLPSKQADDTLVDLGVAMPFMKDGRVYPVALPKVLKNSQVMQRDLNKALSRATDNKTSSHSQNRSDDEHRNVDTILVRDDNQNLSAAKQGRTRMQNATQEAVKSKNASNIKYMLPVLLGNQGPNNQIQAIKLVSIIAQRRNLTLVLAPFFDHGPTLEKQLPHTFKETLDPERLSQFVPVATLEEFKHECNNRVDVIYLGSNMVRDQSPSQTETLLNFVGSSIKVYYNWTKIHIPRTFLLKNESDDIIQIHKDLPYSVAVDDFLDTYPDSLTTSHKCNAFIYPYGYLGRLRYFEHISRYTRYFIRGKVVRETAQKFINTTMKNMTYVCIHWRYNDEWKRSWCLLDYARNLCTELDALTPSQLARNISNFMEKSEIKSAYFASELDNQNALIKGLREVVPNIQTTSDLIDQSERLSRENNFLTSLVEQEVCKESTFFLASQLSSWSEIVKEDRYHKQWKEVNELFK